MINVHFSVPIKVGEKSDNPAGKKILHIEGVAITETVTRNNVKYTREELIKAAAGLVGKPILDTHKHDSIKYILGRVTNSAHMGDGTNFGADIMDADAIEMIQDGRIQHVSIGAKVDDLVRETDGDDVVTAKGIDYTDLSLCSVPGDVHTSISSALSECYKAKSDIMAAEKTNTKEDAGAPPAAAPPAAPAQDPVQMLVEIKNMLQQLLNGGSADSGESDKAKAESSKAIKAIEEKLASVEAQLAPKSKGLVGEAAATEETVVIKGNREEHIQESGKKLVIEHSAGGKVSFWQE
jgi:hypothetical protein